MLPDKGDPYLEGRRNITTYEPIPEGYWQQMLQSNYGNGAQITRLDGVGAGE